ncbi:MAG: hypothetical protein LBH72_07780 [Proteiniphilum sp.]|jgi:hypothetical protein|nr:hypothetical protein [Proteiniphilum sp.]
MLKKFFLSLFLTGWVMSGAYAQQLFTKGDNVVDVAVGLGSYLGGAGYKQSIPPISASYEHGIVSGLLNDKGSIGVGGYLAYTANEWSTKYGDLSYGYKYSYIIFGARGLLHYQLNKLDTYAGLMLGYNMVNVKAIGEVTGGALALGSGFTYSTFIGARYYFTDKVAAFAEVGYGIAALELGVAFKL